MAVIRNYGKPDLFVTVLCNPNWSEITAENQLISNSEKTTIIARVFKLKLTEVLDDLLKKHVLGYHAAVMHVIEFQKRGLPHAHILIVNEENSKPNSTEDIDLIVCAEIPDKKTHPELYETVQKCMIHGPCGKLNPKAPCMVEGLCSKRYPKDFANETLANEDGYPVYRRRDNGLKIKTSSGIEIGNNWIIPYNRYLSQKFNCHINVEICSSVQAVKYLYKYIYKGPDKAQSLITNINQNIDEIKEHIDSRYVSTIEACWHFFGFHMNQRSPPVIRLEIHLEDQENIIFGSSEIIQDIGVKNKKTKLTAWFELNKTDVFSTYHECFFHVSRSSY